MIAATLMVAFIASLASTTEYVQTQTVVFLLVDAAGTGYMEILPCPQWHWSERLKTLVLLLVSWAQFVSLSALWQFRSTRLSCRTN